MQREQARLFREKGQPFAHVGLFAHVPADSRLDRLVCRFVFGRGDAARTAFFGMFQSMTGDAWGFLADLSDQDHMFATFSEPVQVLLFRLTGINGLH